MYRQLGTELDIAKALLEVSYARVVLQLTKYFLHFSVFISVMFFVSALTDQFKSLSHICVDSRDINATLC